MAVDLQKNKDSMLKAWKEVVDDKCSTDWALFGYVKQTNELKLVSTGEDGLEEIGDEFNSGKIMYAFCRVLDPKTTLPKYVLINWQGEGAQTLWKGNCAHHIHDIKHFFKGAHITVNARNEEEVDPDVIMEKVSKSTGSSYSFKDRSAVDESPKPVSSVYKRVQPTSEINPTERDKFWEKQEIEEQKRIKEEQRKLNEMRRKQEQDRKERESKETAAREEIVKERSRSISEIRKAEKLAEASNNRKSTDQENWNKQLQDDMKEESLRKRRSESLREERNQEAQQLIGQRTIDARAMFEQNTSAGQMYTRRSSSVRSNSESYSSVRSNSESYSAQPKDIPREDNLPPKSETPDVLKGTTDHQNAKVDDSPKQIVNQPAAIKSQDNFSYTKNLLKEGLPPRQDSDGEQEDESTWDEPSAEEPVKAYNPPDAVKLEAESVPAIVTQSPPPNQTVTDETKTISARALYDYQAADDTEISFDPDDVITNIDMIDEGWWQGIGPDGSFGLFPANYVEVIQ